MLTPRVHQFEIVDSTNDLALELGRRGEPEGTVVIADRQLRGRGRLGRTWWDEPGQSALLSVLLTPPTPIGDMPRLAFVAGLAAAECLREVCELEVELKWPNDVMLDTRKVAGILIEVDQSTDPVLAVIGIGVNVNQLVFPDDLVYTATSIALATGVCWDVDGLAMDLVDGLFRTYNDYLDRGFEDILTRWRNYMWGLGKKIEAQCGDETVSGIVAGVDSSGALLVETASGEHQPVVAADSLRFL